MMFTEVLSHLENKWKYLCCKVWFFRILKTLKQLFYRTGHRLLQVTLTSYFYLSTDSTISMSEYFSNIKVTGKNKSTIFFRLLIQGKSAPDKHEQAMVGGKWKYFLLHSFEELLIEKISLSFIKSTW